MAGREKERERGKKSGEREPPRVGHLVDTQVCLKS